MLIPLTAVIRRTRYVYNSIDPQIEHLTANVASCKEGCAACCYQIVGMTFAEAITIAYFLVHLGETDTSVLDAASENTVRIDDLHKKCPFLTPGDISWSGRCRIYPARPLACRLHFVTNDPVDCAPPCDRPIQLLDAKDTHKEAIKIIACDDDLLSVYGPLPQFVAHAVRCLLGQTKPNLIDLWNWGRRLSKALERKKELSVVA